MEVDSKRDGEAVEMSALGGGIGSDILLAFSTLSEGTSGAQMLADVIKDNSSSSSKRRKGAKVDLCEQSELRALQREVLLLQRDNQIALKDVLRSAQLAFEGINSLIPNIVLAPSEN